jgi:flagellar basal-body rod protein FlgC
MLEAISARDIAVSGLRAQRERMTIIANNIANSVTTRTPKGGGAFRRQMVVLEAENLKPSTKPEQTGVRVAKIIQDPSPLRQVFDPSHPDANKDGYVSYPNINEAMEMVDLISAQRAYEANIAVIVASKGMNQRALDIIQK